MEKIIFTHEEYNSLPGLSPAAKKLIDLEGTEVLGIKEGKNLLAYAVLSAPAYGEKRILNHIYLSDAEDKESLWALHSFIGEYCKDINLNMIICRFIDAAYGVNSIHALMKQLPQRPLLLNGHRMVYDMKKIKVSKILKDHPDIKKLLPFVKDSSHVTGNQYNSFYERFKKIGRAPSAVTKDEKYDRYFEYKDKIIGYINGFRVGDGTLIITESYVPPKNMLSYAFPAMLYSLLDIMDDNFKKTGSLVVQTSEEPVYRGIVSMLGSPESEELIFEYIMKLR